MTYDAFKVAVRDSNRRHRMHDTALIHHAGLVRGICLAFKADPASTDGAMLDAPEFLPIGCTSNRQDIVQRNFNADEALIEVSLLRGYGKSALLTDFEYECLTNRAMGQ